MLLQCNLMIDLQKGDDSLWLWLAINCGADADW